MHKILLSVLILGLFATGANAKDLNLQKVPEWHVATSDPAYTIRARVIPDSATIRADMELNYVNNTPDTLRELCFRMDLNAWEKGSLLDQRLLVSDDSLLHKMKEGNRGYIRIDSLLAFGIRIDSTDLVYDNTILRAKLPAPVAPGQMVYVLAAFESRLPFEMKPERQYLQFDDWYPRICTATDSGWDTRQYLWWYNPPTAVADYNVMLTIDTSYQIVAAGKLLNERELYGFLPKPNPDSVYLDITNRLTTGVNGEKFQPVYHGPTKDYAFTSSDRELFSFVVMPSFKLDRSYAGDATIEVYYNDRKKTPWADTVARFSREMMLSCDSVLGAFPYNQFLISAGDTTQPFQPDPQMAIIPMDIKREALKPAIARAISSCWFSQRTDLKGLSEFFGEGISYYVTAVLLTQKYGLDAYEMFKKYEDLMKQKSVEARMYKSDRELFNPYVPAPRIDNATIKNDTRLLHAYPTYVARRVPAVLYMLRFVVGDSTLWSSLDLLAHRNRQTPLSPVTFETIVDSVSGSSLNWFFADWSDTTKSYDFGVYSAKSEKTGNGYELNYQLKNFGQIAMPVEIGFVTAEHDTVFDTLAHDDFSSGDSLFSFHKSLEHRPIAVILDPHFYLLDTDRFNNYYFFMPIRYKYQDPPDLFIGFRKL